MMPPRVVVTGIGPVSGIGIGAADFAVAVRNGKSGAAPIASFDTTGFLRVYGCEVPDFDPHALLRRIRPQEYGRTGQFAAAAARLAVEDADLDLSLLDPDRAGVAIGTTGGEGQNLVPLTERWLRSGTGRDTTDPVLAAQVPGSRLSVAVSRELGLAGESVTIGNACSASNLAIGYASDLIRAGAADVMIAGGAESTSRFTHAAFHRLGALAEQACAPFDRRRDGILTGEGGAAVVLERLDAALARGARIYGEVLGYAANCDAGHMVAPEAQSVARCMRLAHAAAGIVPEDVDYICAHGTGTVANDATEAEAIRLVFGERDLPPVSSVKSMIGHAMGAASAFGAVVCMLGIEGDFIPPTINLTEVDPTMPWIDPVAGSGRPARLNVVQNDGFAFGGNNAIVIFGRVE